jgi:glycosyltransferase involved in cell wall biosynthesis
VKRVLFLAYHFPPIGGAGVQRSLKFVRYLPEHGFRPIVVTGPGPQPDDPWTPADTTLGGELPPRITVKRIGRPLPSASTGTRARLERRLRLRTPFADWWIAGAIEAASDAPEADLLFTTLSPYSSAEAAARIAADRRIPWVADLRDPWALDEMRVEPTALHRSLERHRMRTALASASAIVMNTPEAAARVRLSFPELASKVVPAIPNGYDPTDFEITAEPRFDAAFRIVHTGYLHTELGAGQRRHPLMRRLLGGSTTGLDILTRSHIFLVRALEQLERKEPELTIELHLAGVTSTADRAAATLAGVRFRGYLTHDRTIALMRSADLLFLPMHELPEGHRATIIPGKTYEYLGSGRPILAAVPEGDARDLLVRVPQARICRPSDVNAMARVVGELALRCREHGPERDADPTIAANFDRRRLTAQLAGVFTRVLEPQSGPRPAVTVSG